VYGNNLVSEALQLLKQRNVVVWIGSAADRAGVGFVANQQR
jgi:hypothetical protein